MEQKRGIVYIIGVGILILVAIGFFISPLAGTFASGQRAAITFGRYNNQHISYIAGNYFAQQVEEEAQFFAQPGQSSDAFTTRLIWRRSFDAAVLHAAILREADRAGIDISETALDRRIAEHPNFQGADGFDVDTYRALSTQERSRFRSLQRELYRREQYLQDFTVGALTAERESDFFRENGLEERQIDFTVVASSEIDDAEIAEYVAANSQLFEYLRIAVIDIADSARNAKRLREQIADDGSNFYEKRSELNATAPLDLESESERLFFSELADRYPQADAVEQLRTLPVNQVSPLITYGDEQYAVVLIEERQPYDQVAPDELYTYARNYIETRDSAYQEERLYSLMAERRAIITANKPLSLAQIGARNNFPVETTDFFPLNYGNVDLYAATASDNAGYLDGIERNREFLKAVFSLAVDELSEPILHRDNLILLQVRAVRNVDVDEFGAFNDFYQRELERYTANGLDALMVQRDRLFDNFDAIYDEFIAIPVQ